MTARILTLMTLLAAAAQAADPAVEAALELPRERPVHYVDAILALVDLGEPERAQAIAQELAALELTDEQRIELVREAGTARLMRLAKETPVLAEMVLQAQRRSEQANLEPKQIEAMLNKVAKGDADEARAAMLELERTGSIGVSLSLSLLRRTKEAKYAARMRELLVVLYPESGPALLAALNDPNPVVRTQAAYAWGRLANLDRVRSPLPAALLAGRYLLSPAEEQWSQAAAWSYRQLTGVPIDLGAIGRIESSLDSVLAGTLPFPPDHEGYLRWPVDENGTTDRLPAREVALRIAATLADDLARLRTSDAGAERLAIALALETDRPRPEGLQPAETPTAELSECLRLALDENFAKAAIECCGVLGKRRDAAALLLGGAKASPLALGLESPQDAVRFSALEAILAIDSRTPFPGSSRVADVLGYFASGSDERQAVVVAPQIARAANVAGFLAAAGYDATPMNNGAEGLDAAMASPDVELILLDVDTLRPSARETLFRLRRTPETARIPVGLLAADGRYGAAQSLADEHEGVLVSARLHSAEDTQNFVARLTEMPLAASDADQRAGQAKQAGEWIAKLLKSGPRYYRLRGHAGLVSHTLSNPRGDRPFDALAALVTPASQRTLADAASRGATNIEVRRSAADAFAHSVRGHGLLLSHDEILRQYDRYNASETADAETQAVLGAVLDAIEAGRERGDLRVEEVLAR